MRSALHPACFHSLILLLLTTGIVLSPRHAEWELPVLLGVKPVGVLVDSWGPFHEEGTGCM